MVATTGRPVERAVLDARGHLASAYRNLAEQSGLSLDEVLDLARSGQLNAAAMRAQIRRSKTSNQDVIAKKMRLHERRAAWAEQRAFDTVPGSPAERQALRNKLRELRERRARWATGTPSRCAGCGTAWEPESGQLCEDCTRMPGATVNPHLKT